MAYSGWQDAPPDDLGDLDEKARRIYAEEHPPYDPRLASSRHEHGRVREALRTWPEACHSRHPEVGVAALGPLGEALTAEHPYDGAYARGYPLRAAARVRRPGRAIGRAACYRDAGAPRGGRRRYPRQAPCWLYGSPVVVGDERRWRIFSDIDTAEVALPCERVLGEEL